MMKWFPTAKSIRLWSASIRRRGRIDLHRLGIGLGLFLGSAVLGWGIATAQPAPDPAVLDIDPVPPEYQLGQRIYLNQCSSCHVAIPPELLPTQTWQQVLSTPQHYGTTIELPSAFDTELMGRYLRHLSRSLYEAEPVPYRLYQSRFFKALHPQVEFPQQPALNTCVTCHPGANQRNFRSLSPEWQD